MADSARITPEPVEVERQAILAALAAERSERPASSAWADRLLPARGDEDDEP